MNCVVIPVYKDFDKLDKNELASLKQCIKLLGKHHIWFTGPNDLDYSAYINYFATNIVCNLNYTVFDKKYFKNIKGYNKLLCSSLFYDRFGNYECMLIYQLDAYVFRDELDYWANKNLDYIGAPWFENWDMPINSKIIGVGNGGFSLRRICTFQKISKKWELMKRRYILLSRISLNKSNIIKCIASRVAINMLDVLFTSNSIKLLSVRVNEDYYWTTIIPKIHKKFKLATVEQAIKFSFEVNPRYLYTLNNQKLPFGCHAWYRYDYDFYKNYIKFES